MSQVVADKAALTIKALIESEGYSLYDVVYVMEQGQNILRIMIEKPGESIKLDDCVTVSHLIEDVLEVKGVVPAKYTLEVSSPGLNRPLRFKEHFERVLGKLVRVRTSDAIDGRRNFRGKLVSVDGNTISINIDGKDYPVDIALVNKANLEVEL